MKPSSSVKCHRPPLQKIHTEASASASAVHRTAGGAIPGFLVIGDSGRCAAVTCGRSGPRRGGGALTFLGGCKELEQVGLFFIMGGLEKSRAHFSVLGGDFGEKIKKSHAEKCKGRQATTNAKNVRRRPTQKALAKKFRRYVMIRRNFSEFFAFF